MRISRSVACISLALGLALGACKGTEPTTQASGQAEIVNKTCPIMGSAIDPDGATATVGMYKVGFCCPGCIDDFHAWDQAKQEQYVQEQLDGME